MNIQSRINDGGPAFPVPPNDMQQQEEGWITCPRGMSLRDWFAGQVLVGICSDAQRFWDGAAPLAYQYADAMIAARNQPNK